MRGGRRPDRGDIETSRGASAGRATAAMTRVLVLGGTGFLGALLEAPGASAFHGRRTVFSTHCSSSSNGMATTNGTNLAAGARERCLYMSRSGGNATRCSVAANAARGAPAFKAEDVLIIRSCR